MVRMLLHKFLALGIRHLVQQRKSVLAGFILTTIFIIIIVSYSTLSVHLTWHQTARGDISDDDHEGALLREEYQKIPVYYYDSPEMEALRPLIEAYVNELKLLRNKLLQKPYTGMSIPQNWKMVSGYNPRYFEMLQGVNNVHTLTLSHSLHKVASQLPVREFFDYGSTEFGCRRMTSKSWAIYHNGDSLLNRTCETNLSRTLLPHALDVTLLSVGLPLFPYHPPTGREILTFINVVENAVISTTGEVYVDGVCIKTQRCSSTSRRFPPIRKDDDLDKIPYHEEVFTITQQTETWYYHATIEDLPRIAPYLSFLADNPTVKVHIMRSDFHMKMLNFLGIRMERLIWGQFRAKLVYLPAGSACGRPGAFTVGLMSLLFHQRVASRLGRIRRDRIVVIHRGDKSRQFLRHEEIVRAVEEEVAPYNLVVEVFSDESLPSLENYIELFQRAKVVIAVHGAGLSNQILTQPGTLVIEGVCYMEPRFFFCFYGYIPWLCYRSTSRFSLSFRNLATMLGNHYYGIVRKDDCLHVTPDEVREPLQFYLGHLANAPPKRSRTITQS